MKRCLLLVIAMGCGGGTQGVDGGGSDAASDATSSSDSSTSGDASDAGTSTDSPAGDGGLQVGDTCDPNNNLCAAGLLCCSEPTHMVDSSTAYFCEKPVNKGCPMLP
jgi:hypothetical protein